MRVVTGGIDRMDFLVPPLQAESPVEARRKREAELRWANRLAESAESAESAARRAAEGE
jgi:hypothetical protein